MASNAIQTAYKTALPKTAVYCCDVITANIAASAASTTPAPMTANGINNAIFFFDIVLLYKFNKMAAIAVGTIYSGGRILMIQYVAFSGNDT